MKATVSRTYALPEWRGRWDDPYTTCADYPDGTRRASCLVVQEEGECYFGLSEPLPGWRRPEEEEGEEIIEVEVALSGPYRFQ